MKICLLSLFLCVSSAWAQAPAKPADPPKSGAEAIKPDTVIAVVNGRSITSEEMDRIIAPLNPVQKQIAYKEPEAFLQQYAIFDLIYKMAEKDKIDQKSPYKEQIAETRRQILVQAEVNEYKNSIPIMPEEQKKFYELNADKYRETRVKMILIPYGAGPVAPADGKKPLTEAEAKTKAETVVRIARTGVDFVKLVKENSEDPATAEHDGNLPIGIRSNSTNVPENVKAAALALKVGDISDPLKLPNGYVILRAESISVAPYDSVKDEIFKEMKDVEVRKLVDETKKKSSVKVENSAYFSQGAK
jgi:parvulin-like peptidyl-prolyl isomerase